MKILATLVSLSLAAAPALAQGGPQLTEVSRYADGSCGGVLVDGGTRVPFCLEVTKYRAELWLGATHESDAGARHVEPGSDEDRAFTKRLQAWAEQSFAAKERGRIEAADDVHHRSQGWTFASFDRYKEAAIVNRLALYRRIHAARITDVVEGRGTVRLSLKVRDGLGAERLVTFRSFEQTGLRMHFGDAAEPIALGSADERFVLQAMRVYTRKMVPERLRELRWQLTKPGSSDVPREAMRVLSVLIEYCHATAPRLINVFYVKDGGSVIYALVDARGRAYEVKFDKEIGSATIGRMKHRAGGEVWQLVAFGSDQEAKLLAGFRSLLPRMDEHERKVLSDWLDQYATLK